MAGAAFLCARTPAKLRSSVSDWRECASACDRSAGRLPSSPPVPVPASAPVSWSTPSLRHGVPETMKPARIVIADDHELVRKGLAAVIHEVADWKVVAEASNGRQALEQ